MAYQSQDIIRRSATNGFTPRLRRGTTSRRWRSLSTSPPVSAAKPVRWPAPNGTIFVMKSVTNVGVYDNPADLTAKSWTVMRFSEVEQNDKLEWLIRKDGCMHCADPGCLKACPSEGAIIQYANGIVDFQSEQCIGCGYCIAGCPFDVPRLNPGRQPRLQMHLCA